MSTSPRMSRRSPAEASSELQGRAHCPAACSVLSAPDVYAALTDEEPIYPPDWEDRMVAQMMARYPDAQARREAWKAQRRRRRLMIAAAAAIAVAAAVTAAIAYAAI